VRRVVVLTAGARRQLDKLPRPVAVAILELVTGPLADEPYRVSKPLLLDLEGFRVARRGEYRVVVTVDDEMIIVYAAAHRRHIYRLTANLKPPS
jgi:mRNA interferase RelE/StbE